MTHNTTNHEEEWQCTECGNVWDDYSFLDDERLWCPWCESSIVEVKKDES